MEPPGTPPDTGSIVHDEQAGTWERGLGNQDPGGAEQRMETPASPPPEQMGHREVCRPCDRSKPQQAGQMWDCLAHRSLSSTPAG